MGSNHIEHWKCKTCLIQIQMASMHSSQCLHTYQACYCETFVNWKASIQSRSIRSEWSIPILEEEGLSYQPGLSFAWPCACVSLCLWWMSSGCLLYLFMVGFRPRSGASPRPPIVTVLLSKHLRCLPVCRGAFIMPPVHTVFDHPKPPPLLNTVCEINAFHERNLLGRLLFEKFQSRRNLLPSGSKRMSGAWSSLAPVVHLCQKEWIC